jgi:hypothetical protein
MSQVGLWFTFASQSEQLLTDIVQDLAQNFSQDKIFTPHLSFYSYVEISPEDVEDLIENLAHLVSPFVAKTKGISFAEPIHKTLFIETELTAEMQVICDYMENKFHRNYELNPHISLAYNSQIPMETRKKLITEINIPTEVIIDSISYYSPPQGKESAEYFMDWPQPIRVNLN